MRNILNILDRYKCVSVFTKAHIFLRYMICPMAQILKHLPNSGHILDIGCGHGLFANLANSQNPGLVITGIDPDRDKMKWAKVSAEGKKSLTFESINLDDIQFNQFDLICILDVLYLIPSQEWKLFLTKVKTRLKPKGKLIIKEVHHKPFWKYVVCYLLELISINILKITQGKALNIAREQDMKTVLGRIGFNKINIYKIDRGYWLPHILYVMQRG